MQEQPLTPGTLIDGKYRIERCIGAGGMGLVFAATHLKLLEQVAIKILKSERAQDPRMVSRFLREAQTVARLKSHHLARVLDVGTLPDGRPFIVMEYLAGEDLASLLGRRGTLPVRDVVDYVLQACEAIAEAHALGIVHRDLKPANLFLQSRAGFPQIKVLDFGISRLLGNNPGSDDTSLTSTCAFVGSPAYISPEQLSNPEDVDTRADIWALGVIVYELISGVRPFGGATLALTCTNILQLEPATLAVDGVTTELNAALLRALEKSPERRFQNVLELAQALVAHGSPRARLSLLEIEQHRAGYQHPVRIAPEPASPLREGSTFSGTVLLTAPMSRRWRKPLGVAAGLLSIAGIFGILRENRAEPSLVPSSSIVGLQPSPSQATAAPNAASDERQAPLPLVVGSPSPVSSEPEASATTEATPRAALRKRPAPKATQSASPESSASARPVPSPSAPAVLSDPERAYEFRK